MKSGLIQLLRVICVLPLLSTSVTACRSTQPTDGDDGDLTAMVEGSLDRAIVQYRTMDDLLPDTLFPRTKSADGELRASTSEWWTSGFFPGILWYLYEYSGEPDLVGRALRRTRAMEAESLNASDHDIGFKILNSFGHAWRMTGDSTLIPVLATAARTLASRFDPRVGAIRSWGQHPDTTGPYLVIIDNMMNLELLFWAAEHLDEPAFFDLAVRHADKTLEHHFRADGSSYHVAEFDPVTGEAVRKRTEQGYSDESAWARGQAWGLYGFTVAYRETGYARYLDQATKIAQFILGNPRLPEDGVPFWDFDAPDIPNAPRDASAAAITSSALLELSSFVGDSLRARYRAAATTMLRTLSAPPYRTGLGGAAPFLLDHSVGNLPAASEVDVPLSYADYYYVEALLRLRALIRDGLASARVVPIGLGWARSSVNASIFRQSGLRSQGGVQYASFYDPSGRMVLARRTLGTDDWEIRPSPYSGDVRDAHNAISLGVDGNGVLHVSWDQHGGALQYARAVAPGSLALSEPIAMTGRHEDQVTYPQFYGLPDGRLLFVYRDGSSGDGDVVLNRYDPTTGAWSALHHPLIDGEGTRNAYVNQLATDGSGGVHMSWTWRETWDARTNHDILYAYSPDGGTTWQRSTGEDYTLPIREAESEVAVRVPEGRGLINQTTMAVDRRGRPYIATYWRPDGSDVPQYRLVWRDQGRWRAVPVGHRTMPFELAGGGTRRVPLSRPLVLTAPWRAPTPDAPEGTEPVYVVFRDFERGGGITVAVSTDSDRASWRIRDVYVPSVGLWEPVFDRAAWDDLGELHLLVQRVGQGDAETLEELPPQPVSVVEWGRPRGDEVRGSPWE